MKRLKSLPLFQSLGYSRLPVSRSGGQCPTQGALTKFRLQADGEILTSRREGTGNLKPPGKLVRTSEPTLGGLGVTGGEGEGREMRG